MAFEGNTVEPAAGNGNKIQRFGPGHRHVDFRRGQGARSVQTLKVDLDQAGAELARVTSYPASRSQTAPGTGSPSGAQWEHPRPGRPHGTAARQEDSARTRAICGMSGRSRARLLCINQVVAKNTNDLYRASLRSILASQRRLDNRARRHAFPI